MLHWLQTRKAPVPDVGDERRVMGTPRGQTHGGLLLPYQSRHDGRVGLSQNRAANGYRWYLGSSTLSQ
jgi:hypothetical protein